MLYRICINLQIGPNVAPRDSVALHVALDFTRNLIVRNSIQGQNWGVEETHGPPITLIRGQPFKLDIVCDAYEYKVGLLVVINRQIFVWITVLFYVIDCIQWSSFHGNEAQNTSSKCILYSY